MRRPKKPILAVIIASSCILAAIVIIFLVPPSLWLWEILILSLLGTGSGLLVSWLANNRKFGILATLFVILILFLNRLQILNWITFGLLVAVLGLITLIN